MTKKKTSPKKPQAPEAARDAHPEASLGGGAVLRSDLPQTLGHRDLRDGTAVIASVTDAMLDHAAHEAAGLAERLAQHDAVHERTAAPAPAEPTVAATIEAATDEAAADETATDAAAGPDLGAEIGEDVPSTSAEALRRYNAKLIAMMRTNAASTTALFAALVQARSVPEALAINADHLRRQMAALTDQGTELATLAQSIARDTLRSLKDGTER